MKKTENMLLMNWEKTHGVYWLRNRLQPSCRRCCIDWSCQWRWSTRHSS